MKKVTTYFKILMSIFLIVSAHRSYSQCSANFTYTVNSNGNVVFTNMSNLTSSSTYTWDYGDSSPLIVASQTTAISHNYSNGTYYVLLTQKSFTPACTDTIMAAITVTNLPCNFNIIPSFSYTNTGVGTYNFASTSANTTTNTSYSWFFGDNTTATVNPATHTYSVTGPYTVRLILNDGACSDSTTANINVVANSCTVSPAFTYSFNIPGQHYQFTNVSTGTVAATSYTWNFGDGNFSYQANYPIHTYLSPGNYTVTLSATNSTTSPCVVIATQIVNAVGSPTVPCTLAAGYSHTVGTSGSVNFSNTSTGTDSLSLYYWDFGNGQYGNGPNQTMTYTNAGAYNVTLYIDNQTNPVCKDTIVQSVNVTGIPCVANSSYSLALASASMQIWNAMPMYPWNIVAATWNWGDNTSTNMLYTSHTYSAAGMYSICLTVTVSCGATSTTCDTTYIFRMSQQSAQMIQVNVIAPTLIPAGINTAILQNSDFTIYPNPNNGEFELKLTGAGNENVKIKVYNLIGKLVYETETINDTSEKTIKMNEVSNGIYFMKLNVNNKEFTKKIVVSK